MTIFKRPFQTLSKRPSSWEDPPEDPVGKCVECAGPCKVFEDICEGCAEVEGPDRNEELDFEDRDCDYWEKLK